MNDNDLIYWIWLTQLPSIGTHLQRSLLESCHSPETIYNACYDDLIRINGIGPSGAGNILGSRSLENAKVILNNCRKIGIQITVLGNDNYPFRLKTNPDMPVLLYCLGAIKEMEKAVAIVGSRKCSREGRNHAIELSSKLSSEGYAIISGMAIGIDAYAHTAALKADGYTVAVLGNGVDTCYPNAHRDLYEAIIKNGLVISEYPPLTKPRSFNFPMRNRIIAGLSDELYIIDPGRNSGSLITAEYGKKYGKTVSLHESSTV